MDIRSDLQFEYIMPEEVVAENRYVFKTISLCIFQCFGQTNDWKRINGEKVNNSRSKDL